MTMVLLCHLMNFYIIDNGTFMSYDEFLHNYNLPNVYMMQFHSIISATSKSFIKAYIKKICYPIIQMYFDIVLLNEKCTKCIHQFLNSNDLVPTALSRWNNELSVYAQSFSTYHSFKMFQNNHRYHCSVFTI